MMNKNDRQYIDKIMAEPNISSDEADDIWARVSDGDQKAIQRVTRAYLKLVVSIAVNCAFDKRKLMDCIQEGAFGLMRAINNYDHSLGFEFSGIARYHISYRIKDYLQKNVSITNIVTTKNDRKIYNNWKKYVTSDSIDASTIKKMAKELNVPKKDIILMDSKLRSVNSNLSLSQPVDTYGTGYNSVLAEKALFSDYRIPDEEYEDSFMAKFLHDELSNSFDLLTERERDIIESRVMTDEKTTLKDLSEKYDVSIERIRQVESLSLDKLRVAIQ